MDEWWWWRCAVQTTGSECWIRLEQVGGILDERGRETESICPMLGGESCGSGWSTEETDANLSCHGQACEQYAKEHFGGKF